ncbi:unnamed protein product, partial [marine sediment metagenome]
MAKMAESDLSRVDRAVSEYRTRLENQVIAYQKKPSEKPFAELTDDELLSLRLGLPKITTSAALLEKEFPEPKWIVPDIIPEGLSIIAGSPKVGKSLFTLNLAIALSCGGYVFGSIKIKKTPVLYLALEDTERRLQRRLKELGALPSKDLRLCTEWKQGAEGIQNILSFKEARPDIGLVVIDSLQMFRGLSQGGQSYELDYDQLSKIKEASDKLELPIVVNHHTRKMDASDPLMLVSGTLGITGVADTILVLKRTRRQAAGELFVIGRDIEDQELALQLDRDVGWS